MIKTGPWIGFLLYEKKETFTRIQLKKQKTLNELKYEVDSVNSRQLTGK